MNDEDLLKQIRQGDEAAAKKLINRYYSSILRYCIKHCSKIEKAEDLTQETFIKLFQSLSEYEEQGKFKAYLYTIAHRLCINESKKISFFSLADDIIDENNEILRIEDKEEINYLLSVLSIEQRDAIFLRYCEQLSFKEIADIMGCNMRTAQSRVRNALKAMRKELKNEK